MKMKNIGSNMQEFLVQPTEGSIKDLRILFSYQTPVAGWDKEGAFKTEKKFSATTTRHINKYLAESSDDARVVAQEWITEQVAKAK
jgi:hypothetical protein